MTQAQLRGAVRLQGLEADGRWIQETEALENTAFQREQQELPHICSAAGG